MFAHAISSAIFRVITYAQTVLSDRNRGRVCIVATRARCVAEVCARVLRARWSAESSSGGPHHHLVP